MKKYLFGLFAIALAIGFSAFTTEKSKPTSFGDLWFTYDGVSAENDADSYGASSSTSSCPNAAVLCTILVSEITIDGVLDQDELDAALPTLDPDSDGDISEHGQRTGVTDFKTAP